MVLTKIRADVAWAEAFINLKPRRRKAPVKKVEEKKLSPAGVVDDDEVELIEEVEFDEIFKGDEVSHPATIRSIFVVPSTVTIDEM